MTETIYGIYKRRTPIVKFVRLNLKNTVKVATACAILHNIALDWNDEVPVDPHPGLLPDPIPRPAQEVDRLQVQVNLNPHQRRRAAVTGRDHYRALMDPTLTAREQYKVDRRRAEVELRRQARRGNLL